MMNPYKNYFSKLLQTKISCFAFAG